MYAPKPARTTHQHPAHQWGRTQYRVELAHAAATATGIIAAILTAYAIWEWTR